MGNDELNNDLQKDDVYAMLSESGYSDKAIKYFQEKKNIGILQDADQITDLTGPCGDSMKISMNIESDTIDDAKIQVMGCPGAVASACAVVSLAKGKTLEEAASLDMDMLYKELEKLPDQKSIVPAWPLRHCTRPLRDMRTIRDAGENRGLTAIRF